MMKKYLQFGMGLTIGLLVALLFAPTSSGAAGFIVGVIDIEKAVESHPSYDANLAAFEQYKADQIARLEVFRGKTNLSDEDKQAIVTLRNDIDDKIAVKYDALFNPLTQEVIDAVNNVGQESGIEVIIDSQVVLYGGMSLTPAVINAIGG